MTEYKTVIELAKYIKKEIDQYNEAEPVEKSKAHTVLKQHINGVLASPKNRGLIYKGDMTSVVFSKTLGKWRMKVWNDIVENKVRR